MLNLAHSLRISEERRCSSCVAGAPGDFCEVLGKDKAWQRKGSGITQSLSRKGKSVSSIQKAPLPAPLSQEFSELGQRSL